MQQGVAIQSSRVYRIWSVKMFLDGPQMKKPATDNTVCLSYYTIVGILADYCQKSKILRGRTLLLEVCL